jgi:hypothetical protein
MESPPEHRCKDGRTFTVWTVANLRDLRRRYADLPNALLARLLGKTVKAVATKACALGLRKGAERLARMGDENQSKRKDRS